MPPKFEMLPMSLGVTPTTQEFHSSWPLTPSGWPQAPKGLGLNNGFVNAAIPPLNLSLLKQVLEHCAGACPLG